MILQESLTIELKSSFNAECIETLVAFVNAKGGSLYVGMNDDGSVVGINLGKETIVQWINEIKGKTEPSIVPDVEVQAIGNKEVVVFSVKEFPIKPVSVKGKYFKRVGNSNHLLNLNEIMNMHIQTFNSSWDYYIDNQHHITDISEEKAVKLIALYNKNHIIPAEYNVYEFLNKMELIRDGKLTNAGFLLLMNGDFAISDIELGHFYDNITIRDGITISTDLITEVDEVMAFIMKHVSKAMIITGNPAREDRWEYPLDAIREIVMNMIIHRDYTHFGSSSIKIYSDHIEFYNPGLLPDTITAENLQSGKYVSTCRNKIVARVFKEINWIEKYGSGIARVKRIFTQYGSPEPVFEEFQQGFRVVAWSINKNIIADGSKIVQTTDDKKVVRKYDKGGLKKVGEKEDKGGLKAYQIPDIQTDDSFHEPQVEFIKTIKDVKVGEKDDKRGQKRVGEEENEGGQKSGLKAYQIPDIQTDDSFHEPQVEFIKTIKDVRVGEKNDKGGRKKVGETIEEVGEKENKIGQKAYQIPDMPIISVHESQVEFIKTIKDVKVGEKDDESGQKKVGENISKNQKLIVENILINQNV
ncbi:MAG: putative DNA binding domain-containing protein, partial [Prevotellaceae bacterium]|nr:putative DNA binding domain-containing protein [Prevotellaceae bacterium]